ncbi:ornithine cyclodeaminase family protein [Streptomyces sp. NPDC095613]|uniref:ornithine cyclodeaminase family protein n=1 Tax=Streptomyces sp. NPDC095613 TaxID=3155540 RepID=UPI00331F8EB7
MTEFFTDDDVRAAFDGGAAIEALRRAYGADVNPAQYPARSIARGDGSWLRIMSGVSMDTHLMGAKLISVNGRTNQAAYLIPLFDEQTCELVALLDGNSITGFRTAATSALAADQLAPAGPLVLTSLGSGFEAQKHVRALSLIRPVAAIHVWSPRQSSRERFVDAVSDLGVPVHAHDSAEKATGEGDLIVCSGRSPDQQPYVRGAWLRPGHTVLSIGSTLPEQREVDTELLTRADLIVADMPEEVLRETGDLLAASVEGMDLTDAIVSLADVTAGRVKGRTSADQITVYKSVGSGLQDLTVAAMCVERTKAAGRGTTLPVTTRAVTK